MTQPLRNTALRSASYRRLVLDALVTSLRTVFTGAYDRDRQFQNLKITPAYPRDEQDYPCVVIDFSGSLVARAGVGHYEIFDDVNGNVQKWLHNRFEGSATFTAYALSTVDRDIFLDALVEVFTFGTLYNDTLDQFWIGVYGDPADNNVELQFSQLMLNLDQIHDSGNNVSVAPWRPEDQLIYSSALSFDCHGGFYNIVPEASWEYITGVGVAAYPQGEINVDLPFGNIPGQVTNPRQFFDDNEMPDPALPNQDPPVPNTLKGVAIISGDEGFEGALVPLDGQGSSNP